MLRMTEKIMSGWLSHERKRINEIMSTARKKEPTIQTPAKTFDETLIDPVVRAERATGTNMIFDMIGTTGTTNTYRQPEKSGAPDVIGALYEQYCRALDDPLASFSGDWNSVAQNEGGSTVSHERESKLVSHQNESIEAVISGVRGVEHFFGKLEPANSPPAFTLEPVPEILHLFAPPEFKAREALLPSALVRREHHAPGIDSPLFAPRRAQSEPVV